MRTNKANNSKNNTTNVSEIREEKIMSTTELRKALATEPAITFAKNTQMSRKENDMDALNIVANPCFTLVENKKLNGMELTFRGYVSPEQFEDLRKMGWNYSSKFNKPFGKYWAKFNALLWNDTAELINGNWITVLADKPEPIKDYSHKPVLTQRSRQLLVLTGTRHFSKELHEELCKIGWSYFQKTNTYEFRCTVSCKKIIAKTQELLKDKQLTCNLLEEPKAKSKGKSKSKTAPATSEQMVMNLSPAVAEQAADLYDIFR